MGARTRTQGLPCLLGQDRLPVGGVVGEQVVHGGVGQDLQGAGGSLPADQGALLVGNGVEFHGRSPFVNLQANCFRRRKRVSTALCVVAQLVQMRTAVWVSSVLHQKAKANSLSSSWSSLSGRMGYCWLV